MSSGDVLRRTPIDEDLHELRKEIEIEAEAAKKRIQAGGDPSPKRCWWQIWRR